MKIMPPKKPKAKATTKMSKKPIPEDFELSSDEETKVDKIDENKRMKSKDKCLNCPHCICKLLLQNSIEIKLEVALPAFGLGLAHLCIGVFYPKLYIGQR